MSARFQVLDWRETPMGTISLRRRRDPVVDRDVHEIKLNDEFLMSSLFTVAEVEVARLALAELVGTAERPGASRPPATGLDVAVGGLGLGYTAQEVLEHPDVRSLVVVEALGEVIEWHEQGLMPVGDPVTSDPRCRTVHGDFFALLRSDAGLDPTTPDRRFHAVIVDIDHSPRHLLHPGHADFYDPPGTRRLAERLRPGGVFALWSNDPPDAEYQATLAEVFAHAEARVVSFHNPLQDRESANTVYLARTAPE